MDFNDIFNALTRSSITCFIAKFVVNYDLH